MAADRVVLQMHEWAGGGFGRRPLSEQRERDPVPGSNKSPRWPKPWGLKLNSNPSKHNEESLKIFPGRFQMARVLVQMSCWCNVIGAGNFEPATARKACVLDEVGWWWRSAIFSRCLEWLNPVLPVWSCAVSNFIFKCGMSLVNNFVLRLIDKDDLKKNSSVMFQWW